MPFDGSGNFTRVHNWVEDRDNEIRILATRHDEEDDGFAEAFNEVFLRNGVVPMSGTLKAGGNNISGIAAGSAALPSVTFGGDVTTGMYLSSPGVMSFSASGIERVRVSALGAYINGKLGIGTTSPRTVLDVVGIGSFQGAFEDVVVDATALTGVVNVDYLSGAIIMHGADAAGNWSFNVRANDTTTLDSIMGINQCLTFAVEVPQGDTAFYCTTITIDSVAPSGLNWQGGAPTAGNPDGVDVYLVRVVKIAPATFLVRASQSQEI